MQMNAGEAIDCALYKLTRSVADRNDGLAEIKALLSTETSGLPSGSATCSEVCSPC